MKKVKVFVTIFLLVLLFYSNNVYATTTGKYVPDSEGSGIEKFILIAIGVGLVSLVLFIGYKIDKKDESKKRRDKYINKDADDEEDEENPYSKIYKAINYDEEPVLEEEKVVVGVNNNIEKNEKSNFTEKTKAAYDYNYNDDEKKDEDENENEGYAESEELSKENDEENVENTEVSETEEEIENDFGYVENNKNIEKMISVFENSDSTMVFNSNELKEMEKETVENINNNSSEDFDEEDDDDDLSDLEEAIKAANIKKYTRKKPKEEPKKNPKKIYTRKKESKKVDDEKEEEKSIEEKIDELETIEKVEEKPKPKRGRPRKSDTVDKPKRGRPRKTTTSTSKTTTKTGTKGKRGRPKKEDSAKTKTKDVSSKKK